MNRPPRPQRLDGGLVWTFFVSAAVHAAVLGVFLVAPNRYLASISPPAESYTVDLIAADAIGGTSGPTGSGSEPELPVAPSERVDDAPPLPAPPAAPVAEQVAAADEVPPPEPAPPVAEQVAAADEVPPPEPAPVTAPEPVPEKVEVAAVKPDLVEAPAVEAAETPTPLSTAAPPRRAATQKPAPSAVQKAVAPTRAPVKATTTPNAAAERDRRIAKAIEQRVGAVGQPAADDRIAAAVRRRTEQLSGGGDGVSGPLSSGPGGAAGAGTIIGAEYILYKRRMEARIRDAWVWGGPQEQLESVVRFSVSPEGEIGDVRTTRTSGDRAYDASAERAVRAASPLGMVPPTYRQEFADVELTFRARDLQQ